MKALSIRQPWAWAILNAGKRVENREWDPHGGNVGQARNLIEATVLIHAGKGCTVDEYEGAVDFLRDVYAAQPWEGSTVVPRLKNPALTRGALVARARLADLITTDEFGHRWPSLAGSEAAFCQLCRRYQAAADFRCPKADPWAIPGCVGLVLADVEPLGEPIPFKGALGFFNVPDELLVERAPGGAV